MHQTLTMNTRITFSIAMLSLACTLAAPAAAQAPSDSLLLYLPFDGNANDASGNGNNATVFNAVLDTNRFGEPNKSYRFNGLDSYIEIPASPSMNKIQTSDVVSISAWININAWHSSGNVFSIFERYNSTTDAGWLYEANWVTGGILWLADETNASNVAGCNFSWNFHQWYFVCLTYNQAGDTAHFYVDGVHVCATPYTAPINVIDTTTSFVIGRSLAGPDEYSDGWIDDVRVYNRVLTASEVGSIFSSVNDVTHSDQIAVVFPNPANDLVEVHLSQPIKTEFVLTDVLGRIVKRQYVDEDPRVSLSELTNGLYTYRLSNANGVQTGRLVVR